jgi:hypothetical protein
MLTEIDRALHRESNKTKDNNIRPWIAIYQSFVEKYVRKFGDHC